MTVREIASAIHAGKLNLSKILIKENVKENEKKFYDPIKILTKVRKMIYGLASILEITFKYIYIYILLNQFIIFPAAKFNIKSLESLKTRDLIGCFLEIF